MADNSLADTNGWDLVYAIHYDDVNRSILLQWNDPAAKLPQSFSLKGTIEGKSAQIDGTFNPWQLALGGAGDKICLALPIPSVTVETDFLPKKARSVVMKNLVALITVEAAFIPPDVAQGQPPSSKRNLKVKTGPDAVSQPDVRMADGSAFPDDWTFPKATLQTLLQSWLDANLQAFTYVFHTVDLAAQIAQSGNAGLVWLTPTDMTYAVVEPAPTAGGTPTATLGNSVFAILAMTENRVNTMRNNQVSPFAIPTGSTAGLLVSPSRFLTKFLMGGVHTLFKSASPTDFALSVDGQTITNVTDQAFNDMSIQDNDGNAKTVSPDIKAKDFTITFSNSQLSISLTNFHWTYSPGIDVYTNYTSNATICADQFGQLNLQVTSNSAHGMITESTSVMVADIVDGIVLAMAGGALGGFLGGLAAGGLALKAGAEVAGEVVVEGGEVAAAEALDAAEVAEAEAAEAEAMGDAEEEVEAAEAGQPSSRLNALKGFLSRNWAKILGSIIGAGTGATIAEIPKILEVYANKDAQDAPNLNPFLGAVAMGMQWPNSVNPKITSAQFNGCLQFGVDPNWQV